MDLATVRCHLSQGTQGNRFYRRACRCATDGRWWSLTKGADNVEQNRAAGPSVAIPHPASGGLLDAVYGCKIVVQLTADVAHGDLFAAADHCLIGDIRIATRLQPAKLVQKTAVLNLSVTLAHQGPGVGFIGLPIHLSLLVEKVPGSDPAFNKGFAAAGNARYLAHGIDAGLNAGKRTKGSRQ